MISEMLDLDPEFAAEVSIACRGDSATPIAAAVARLLGAANEKLEDPW
jgi:hypothetical protein